MPSEGFYVLRSGYGDLAWLCALNITRLIPWISVCNVGYNVATATDNVETNKLIDEELKSYIRNYERHQERAGFTYILECIEHRVDVMKPSKYVRHADRGYQEASKQNTDSACGTAIAEA